MKTCECCQKEIDGSYGAGRFCNRSCAAKYVSKQNREDKNQKIGKTLNKRARFAEITCESCKRTVTKPWNRRKHRFCSKKCSIAYNSQDLEIKQKIRDARCKAIENGNIGFGIRCTFEGIRCDSALEYTFLKWYKQDHPNASIKRYTGKIESQGITFIPDFIIDDRIVVEVKYRKEAINYRLGSKWSGYIELQDKKKEILSSLGTDYIWFTDESCGQSFYRRCLKEVKEQHVTTRSTTQGSVMKTYDKIVWPSDLDIQERDKAIVELWSALDSYVRMVAQTVPASEFDEALKNPTLTKYASFVEKTRYLFGL